jgi:CDP-diacylglycerol pyrophosphatase
VDSGKFDELTRALATSTSRRGTIKVLFTSVLGGALGFGGIGITQAVVVDPYKAIKTDQCTGTCGSTSDKDPLWCIAYRCIHGKRKCFKIDSAGEWVLTHPGGNNYTLIAGHRVTGIECHKIWDSAHPDYWEFAWQAAQKHLLPHHLDVGMAINSAHARNYC